MKKTNDSIVFESRYEIGDTIHALEQWLDTHHTGEEVDTVKQMVKLLDSMAMNW